jgi:hypothetical protein
MISHEESYQKWEEFIPYETVNLILMRLSFINFKQGTDTIN